MLCFNFYSVVVYISAVMEFWQLPLKWKNETRLNFLFYLRSKLNYMCIESKFIWYSFDAIELKQYFDYSGVPKVKIELTGGGLLLLRNCWFKPQSSKFMDPT